MEQKKCFACGIAEIDETELIDGRCDDCTEIVEKYFGMHILDISEKLGI